MTLFIFHGIILTKLILYNYDWHSRKLDSLKFITYSFDVTKVILINI